jgi:hypothetical protein
MQQALQYMRSCQINVKILTGNSSSLLFKLSWCKLNQSNLGALLPLVGHQGIVF